MARDLPLATLRVIDLARALALEPRRAAARRDDGGAASRPHREGPRRRGSAAGDRPIRSSSSPTGSSRSRPCATARRSCATARPSASSTSRPVPRSASSQLMLGPGALVHASEAARSRAPPVPLASGPPPIGAAVAAGRRRPARRRRSLHDVSFELRVGEVLGLVALEGQGQDELFEVLAGARRPDGGRPRSSMAARPLRTPGRRHPRGARVRARQPGRGTPDAALGAREHRTALLRAASGDWGPIDMSVEEPTRVDGAIDRLQIDTRAQSEVRRLSGGNQQKVTIARWIAQGVRDAALLRPDTRHRHPYQARDLRAAARAGGRRRRGPAVHVRARGGPTRLRPGRGHLRRARRGGDARCRGGRARRSCAPRTGCHPALQAPEEVAAQATVAERRMSVVAVTRRPAAIRGDRAAIARTLRRQRVGPRAVRAAGVLLLVTRAHPARLRRRRTSSRWPRRAARRPRRGRPGGRRHRGRHRPVGRLDDGAHERHGGGAHGRARARSSPSWS